MTRTQTGAAFVRRHKWKFVAAHSTLLIGLLIAFLVGAFAGPALKTVFGQKLNKTGQRFYKIAEKHQPELGQKHEHETLPAAQAARIVKLNDAVAVGSHPHPLATPQPVTFTALVRNHSIRSTGAHVLLWVVHDAEMPNCQTPSSLQCLRALAAWFNNPASQASSNYGTDGDGNTVLMVPCDGREKAWHVAFFNSWACGDEFLGYASQTAWPEAQLRAGALIAARDSIRFGFPVQRGAIAGCTIVRPGIIEHAELGGCGGGHHDPGLHFPLDRFIALVAQYKSALLHPVQPPARTTTAHTTTSSSKPPVRRVAAAVLRAKRGYWSWLAWKLGRGSWKGWPAGEASVRPHVPATVPAAWWKAEARFLGGH